ncbi:MAG: hypothetical protein Kow0010_08280 [Dehalococcoidia bacterium]
MIHLSLRWSMAAVALVVVAAAAGAAGVWTRASSGTPAHGFDLEGQPADVVASYRFVEQHAGLVSTIPCYCGCGKSLDHQSLRDCYLKPNGSGYEGHASVCSVCLEEVADIERLLTAGEDTAAIRSWIDREYSKFGPPTATP